MSFRRMVLACRPCQSDGCSAMFIGPKQRQYCDDCNARRIRERKGWEPADLSSAEIEAKYQAALKEIRRERTHEGETTWHMSWKYE